MFNDDVSEINSAWCNVLTSEDTLSSYNGRNRSDFVFNGGRWINYRNVTNVNIFDISGYNCIDVTELNSNAQFVPFFYLVAFVLFFITVLIFRWSVRGILGRY